jgi:flagella basal body P-ring formation protein FlgA
VAGLGGGARLPERGGVSPRCLALVLLAGITVWPVCGRADAENPDAVAEAVRQAAQALAPSGATLSLGPVAGARYMKNCTAPLAVSISGVAPYEQASVRCPAPGWTLYVTVTVAQSEAVVVAARPLIPGQALTADDLKLATLPVQQFAGRQVYFDQAQLIGATPSMALAAGMPLTSDAVQAPIMVKAGQTVTVNVQSGGVVLSLDATAQQTGRIGDTILLTNPSTGRRFTAQVTAQGVELVLQ